MPAYVCVCFFTPSFEDFLMMLFATSCYFKIDFLMVAGCSWRHMEWKNHYQWSILQLI